MKIGNIELLNVDCMEYMKTVPDKHFDLAIVDPPYGINAGKMTMGSGNHKFKKGKDWDKSIPDELYFNELLRISKNQVIWGGNYFTDYLYPTSDWLVWDKRNPNLSFAEGELAWVSKEIGKNLRIYNVYSASQQKIHPTQKPVELYKWILENYAKVNCNHKHEEHYRSMCTDCSNKKVKILDTHLGSGSIAIACHDYKFELTGTEIDKDYFDAAVKRLQNHVAQTVLF